MKYLIFIKTILISCLLCNGSPLQEAIKLRLSLKDVLGDKIIYIKSNGEQSDVCYFNLESGAYKKNVYKYKIDLTKVSLDDFQDKEIIRTYKLDSLGVYYSERTGADGDKYFSTKKYLELLKEIKSDMQNSLIISNVDFMEDEVVDKELKKLNLELSNSMTRLGLELKYKDNKKSLIVKNIIETCVASEFGFHLNDEIKKLGSTPDNSSLKNVLNYRFDPESDFLNFNILRDGKDIELKILKPSTMEINLNSYESHEPKK